MNYVLISIRYFPDYLKFVINSILSVDKDASVFILGNDDPKYKNTTFINLNDIESDGCKEFYDYNIYENTIFENNPLWLTSVLRIFYLEQFRKKILDSKFVHFDNDVLIYKPFKNVDLNLVIKEKLNITSASQKKLVFGYSVIQDLEPISIICNKINKISKIGKKEEWEFNSGKPYNEMQFLGKIFLENNGLINLLPTLPYYSDIIFDPSNYGQYFDGTHIHPKKRFSKKKVFNQNENIDREIKVKRISPYFKNSKPFVTWNNKKYDLMNLHIHSKRFSKYLPIEYKNYI